jgi:hypothetical protein
MAVLQVMVAPYTNKNMDCKRFCGNTSTASRTVNWIADLTPPVLTTGGTGTSLGCNPSAGDIDAALGTATATDACGIPTVTSSDGNVTSDGCARTQTRTWTARDFVVIHPPHHVL